MRTPSTTSNLRISTSASCHVAFATRARNVGSTSKDITAPTVGPRGVPRANPLLEHRHTWHFRAISGSYLAATHNACTTNTLIHASHVRRSHLLFSSSHRYLPHVQSGTFQPAAKCCQWVAHNRRLFQPTVPTNLTQVARVQLTSKVPSVQVRSTTLTATKRCQWMPPRQTLNSRSNTLVKVHMLGNHP